MPVHRPSGIQGQKVCAEYCLDLIPKVVRGTVVVRGGGCILAKDKAEREGRCTLLKCRRKNPCIFYRL